jgi:hypothetical protein
LEPVLTHNPPAAKITHALCDFGVDLLHLQIQTACLGQLTNDLAQLSRIQNAVLINVVPPEEPAGEDKAGPADWAWGVRADRAGWLRLLRWKRDMTRLTISATASSSATTRRSTGSNCSPALRGGVTRKRRCTYRPSVIYLIVNKHLFLSLSLSLSFSNVLHE